MTQKQKTWVRYGFFGAITAALIVTAILLMVQCVAIYRMGDKPFTRDSVAEHFAPIATPVYICLGLVAAGFALSPLLPAAPDSKPDRDAVTLSRLQAQVDVTVGDPDLTRRVCRLRRERNRHHNVTLVLLAIGTVVFLWYALDVSRFSTEDINGSMIKAMFLLLPCMGVPALYAVLAAYLCRISVRQEIALLRVALRDAFAAHTTDGQAVNPADPKEKNFTVKKSGDERWMPYVQTAVLLVGVVLVVLGLLENGAAAVLTKAINICTECIGLG